MGQMAQSKDEQRRAALARRDALTTAQRAGAAQALAEQGLPFDLAPGEVVSGYMPIRSEIDPRPLMQALAGRGARLALPVVVARDQPLVFRQWMPQAPLIRGGLDILEPSAEAPACDPQIVLVPLAAFDRAGHRIGYGAGHYDRTLARLCSRGPVVTVGLAFSVQQVDRVPALPHDIALDYIATEHEIIETRSH